MLTFPDPLAPEDSDELIWENLPPDTEVDIDGEYAFSIQGDTQVYIAADQNSVVGGKGENSLLLVLDIVGTHVVTFSAPNYENRVFELEIA